MYKYKIVSLTFREEYKLSVFENRMFAGYVNLRRGSDKRVELHHGHRGCGMKWSCLTLMYDLPAWPTCQNVNHIICKNVSANNYTITFRLIYLYNSHWSLRKETYDTCEYMPKNLWLFVSSSVVGSALILSLIHQKKNRISHKYHTQLNCSTVLKVMIPNELLSVCLRSISLLINQTYVNRKQITALPEPQTTNMNRASNPGPTGYLSSWGFCNTINMN